MGTLNLFVQGSIEYEGRPIGAGVPTELILLPGVFHVFDGIASDAEASRHFRGR